MQKTKNTVLIVEDEADLRELLKIKLTNEGFEVLEAENGKVGLESSLKNHPDIILLDIIMPVMDGPAMMKELRKDEWGKNASVIILSNLKESEKVGEGLSKDISGYLVKSDLEPNDMVALIRKQLSKNR